MVKLFLEILKDLSHNPIDTNNQIRQKLDKITNFETDFTN